jgi:GNAT superfamily N-acetyltransferase
MRLIDDVAAMPVSAIHTYLANESYWAAGIPIETVRLALTNSICVCAIDDAELMGFARVISDRATFAYLCDVFVVEPYRRRGVAQAMLTALDTHPSLQGLRRSMLVTRDAHTLYAKFGYQPLAEPGRVMERRNPDVYQSLRTRG